MLNPNSPLKLMIIGVHGQVGWQLHQQALKLKHLGTVPIELIPVARHGTPITVDLINTEEIRQVLRHCKPDIVINAAAYTAVDRAEAEPELALHINATGPEILAEELAKLGGLLVHYSTDYVFSGQQTTPYLETDPPQPINVYGQSKFAGEQAIQAIAPKHLIFRTSWVYDGRGKNFLLTMVKLAQSRSQVQVVSDQQGSPTSARLIAEITYRALNHLCLTNDSDPGLGLYHLTSLGLTSWYGFAEKIFAQLAQSTPVPMAELIPIPTTNYPTPAHRPPFSGLNCQKLMQTFGLTLPAWDEEFLKIFPSLGLVKY